MTDNDFKIFSSYIKQHSGINLSPEKRYFLKSRLQNRLDELHFRSYAQYLDYILNSKKGKEEASRLINRICIHKTEFFRDSHQYDHLQTLLPSLIEKNPKGKEFRIWSAGCSTGEEAYSLAMLLMENKINLSADVRIYGTDISTNALKIAHEGIYASSKIANIPDNLKKKYFMKGKGSLRGMYKTIPELNKLISFNYHNLNSEKCKKCNSMNVIFCRNVLIYFDQATVKKVVNRLEEYLVPGGYIFFGGTESFPFIVQKLKMAGPNIYWKPDNINAE